eukprot:3938936-Lingulodinium_polyedra.AAC.1
MEPTVVSTSGGTLCHPAWPRASMTTWIKGNLSQDLSLASCATVAVNSASWAHALQICCSLDKVAFTQAGSLCNNPANKPGPLVYQSKWRTRFLVTAASSPMSQSTHRPSSRKRGLLCQSGP